MSKNDSPAGSTGGPVTVPALDDLPDKMRVHMLAKLIGLTSREVLAALAGLGHEVRSVQSSIDRKVAEQVVIALVPGAQAEEPVEDPRAVGSAAADDEGAAAESTAAPLAPLFAPPTPLFQPPEPPARRPAEPEAPAEEAPTGRRRRRSRAAEPVVEEQPAAEAVDEEAEDTDDAPDEPAEDDGAERRRRRRGRRGRGRGRGGEDNDDAESGEDSTDDDEETEAEDTSDEEESETTEGTRRRRRRRRRRGAGDDTADTPDDDPPGTVTRIRAPREAREESGDGDGVQSVRGSTRLEAKRQRRRDGRDAGRRRPPILSEAEFLARRESVERMMVVRAARRAAPRSRCSRTTCSSSTTSPGATAASLVGNVYLGRVQNVLPSMEAAFVDIGRGRNAVLYAGEVELGRRRARRARRGASSRRVKPATASLVQVTKDPIGHKGARLTSQIVAARPLPGLRARAVVDRHQPQAARHRAAAAQGHPARRSCPRGRRDRPHRGRGRRARRSWRATSTGCRRSGRSRPSPSETGRRSRRRRDRCSTRSPTC